ncbi:MAG: hypothetical protein ACQERO_15250 [Bacteroidota bacterium]
MALLAALAVNSIETWLQVVEPQRTRRDAKGGPWMVTGILILGALSGLGG